MPSNTSSKKKTGMRAKIQRFGGVLSGMVMPNIGAFIAWGLLTALFLYPTGWVPNEFLATLISPILTYFLPVMIGFTAGENVYGHRGGILAALVTMGVVVGTNMPMFMGAMIVGPLSAMLMKWVDSKLEGHIPAGFEMIVNNFSMGFLGLILLILAYVVFGPFIEAINMFLSAGVNWIINHRMIPFSSIFIEPAKVLFLNNAINHGILSPIGVTQAAERGKSILFILEPNPGPGLGVLLAYTFFGKGDAKSSAPGVAIIHCIGGIHEPYFPFILMLPQMIIASICGAVCGNFIFQAFDIGLVATASPGSFFSILAVAPRSDWLPILLGIFVSTAVSFAVGSLILRRHKDDPVDVSLEEAKAAKDAMKAEGALKAAQAAGGTLDLRTLDHIIFACDAGMGSSAMGAALLKKKLETAGLYNIKVEHISISKLQQDTPFVVCHEDLEDRARLSAPGAMIVTIQNFMSAPQYDLIVEMIKDARINKNEETGDVKASDYHGGVLIKKNIILNNAPVDKETAIRKIGQILVDSGYVTEKYVDGMIEKEEVFNTAIGNSLAIPHGIESVIGEIKNSGLAIMTYPEGIDWGEGETVKLVIAVASAGDDHVETLGKIATTCESEEAVEKILHMSVDEIYELFK